MENRNSVLISVIAGLITFILIFTFLEFNDRVESVNTDEHICKEDSLQKVINDLIIEKENDEDGWDDKEKRYEQILFEYEYGLDHLKHYHPEAYKEFHRILSYKEHYSKQDERENKKRLKNGNSVDLWR
jgi:hypothetical protein